jgi:hypothetical protein
MPEQATVDPEDIEDIVTVLKEANGPLPLDTLVERYVARLKNRVIEKTEAPGAAA